MRCPAAPKRSSIPSWTAPYGPSFPHARLAQEFRRGVLQHPGPDRGLDLFARPELEHHRLYAPQVQEVRD